LESILGKENIEVMEFLKDMYMPLLEESNLVIDSYPFGGYNTILDALYLKKPVITLPGTKAYNRFAQSLLKDAGLDELIAQNTGEYINLVLQLTNNEEFLQ